MKAVLYAVLGVWALGELAMLFRNRGDVSLRDDPTTAVMGGSLTVAFIAAFEIGEGSRPAPIHSDAVQWAGIAILLGGITLRAWAIRTLGRYFTYAVTVREDQAVVDAGPYRLVRHPSYTGLLVALIGLGLALGDWVALAVAVVPALVGITIRIRSEETALERKLGERYREYEARTSRLVPGLW